MLARGTQDSYTERPQRKGGGLGCCILLLRALGHGKFYLYKILSGEVLPDSAGTWDKISMFVGAMGQFNFWGKSN